MPADQQHGGEPGQLLFVATFCQDEHMLRLKIKTLPLTSVFKEEERFRLLLRFLCDLEPLSTPIEWTSYHDPTMILSLLMVRKKSLENKGLEQTIDRLFFYCRRDEIPLFTFFEGVP